MKTAAKATVKAAALNLALADCICGKFDKEIIFWHDCEIGWEAIENKGKEAHHVRSLLGQCPSTAVSVLIVLLALSPPAGLLPPCLFEKGRDFLW